MHSKNMFKSNLSQLVDSNVYVIVRLLIADFVTCLGSVVRTLIWEPCFPCTPLVLVISKGMASRSQTDCEIDYQVYSLLQKVLSS